MDEALWMKRVDLNCTIFQI